MANKDLFRSLRLARETGDVRPADRVNEAGGRAYSRDARGELAQYVMTGCLNGTYYADAGTQLERVLELAAEVETGFLARLAVYSRREGHMKDMPALLLAVVSRRDAEVFRKAAPLVLDSVVMIRNFVQIIRSGAVGRKSLGSAPKRVLQDLLARMSDEALFRGNVGKNPSLADIIRLVHPKPEGPVRESLYAHLTGKSVDMEKLPGLVREYENFRTAMLGTPVSMDSQLPIPDVPFQMLTSLPLSRSQWRQIAEKAGWTATRMNLNTFLRHGVFHDPGGDRASRMIAARLSDPKLIRKARVFPYQLLIAYINADKQIPPIVRNALQDAMETATSNVPQFPGTVVICPDVSGSMHTPVTGYRRGSTTSVSCIQVASLLASVILRQNRNAILLPFHDRVLDVALNPRDSVMTNAQILSALGPGGTDCSRPLDRLNSRRIKADLVIYISDNQSWMPAHSQSGFLSHPTGTMLEWERFRRRNPKARLVCLDIQPYGTTQAHDRSDILNIGGFSDSVFSIIDTFARGNLGSDFWADAIDRSVIDLESIADFSAGT